MLLRLVLLLMLVPLVAQAQQGVAYKVEIDAGKYSDLLRENLEISQRSKDTDLPADELQRLLRAVPAQARALLATEGYFSPAIRQELRQSDTPWTVRIEVEPGTPTRVASVDIRFKGDLAAGPHADMGRMNRLRQLWKIDPGDIFRQAAWTEAKNDLLKRLLVQDYPGAAITDSEALINPQAASAALTVEVDSGPAVTFGNLEIHGLKRYSRDLIDHLNPIKPGEPYSQEKLNELQSRLEDSGYFRSAFATVEVDPAKPRNAPIRLDLTESQRKRLSLGAGFSTDSGARGQVRWTDRNFLERNWRLESELRVDRETQRIGGDIFLPRLAADWAPAGWQPSVGAHLERTDSAGEVDDKIRTGARLTSPNKNDEKVWALSYLGDRQRIGDTIDNYRQALVVSFTYTRRRLNHPLIPSSGYAASVEIAGGPRGAINETNLLHIFGRALWLKPLTDNWRSVMRAQAGQVFGGNSTTIPADLLFRTGGDTSVRGYGYNTLGVPANGAIVGGTVTAVMSAELIYQLTPQWGAAVFVDTGNAANSWSNFEFKTGSGVGARWRSPIGAVNVDLAYGYATQEIRLHFSVGYGF